MKSFRIFALAAAFASSVLSTAVLAQGSTATFTKAGGGVQATCTYTGLTIINGTLDITCSTDVNYTGPGGGGGGGTGPYALTVSVSPASSGTVSGADCTTGSTGACNGSVAANASTSVTATAATGYTFANWSGGPCSGSTNATCTIASMTGAITMQANFNSTGGGGGGGVVPPGCTGLTPTTNYQAFDTLGPSLQSTKFTGVQGKIYSFPLPTSKGSFGTTNTVFTPGSLTMEIAISQCPGDFTYYKTTTASVSTVGKVLYPCGAVVGYESGGLSWNTAQSAFRPVCLTPTGQNWYINLRMTAGCPSGTCEIYYFWNP